MFRSDKNAVSSAVLAAIGLYTIAVFLYQTGLIVDSDYLHEEMRLLFRYHPTAEPALFADDYLASFVGAFAQPLLYDWINRLWLWGGGDLIVLHRVIPLVCWLTFLAGLAVAARKLGDRVTVLGAVALAVAQPVYLYQITSALPHAFAFPLLIWAFVALLHGSAPGLALATILAGLLYPAIAPLAGLLLGWHVVITERLWAAGNAVRVKNLFLVAVTALLSLWLLYQVLSGPPHLGAALAPTESADVYPENGPEGRHFYGVFNPLKYVAAKAFAQFYAGLENYRLLLLLVYCIVGIYGVLAAPKDGAGHRALFAFIACSAAVFLLVLAAKPFFVYRFILYPAFTVLPLLFVIGLQQLCRRLGRVLRAPQLVAVALLGFFLLALDGFDQKKLGYWWRLGPEAQPIVDFADDQPPETLFAIWPGDENELELLSYLSRRPLLVQYKAHYPSYEGHILEMRARMQALIEAYFATEEAPLRNLHCRWGVDYLVAEKAHFGEDAQRPEYFAPFDARIEEIWQSSQQDEFLLRSPAPALVALDTERYFVVRLPGPCEPD